MGSARRSTRRHRWHPIPRLTPGAFMGAFTQKRGRRRRMLSGRSFPCAGAGPHEQESHERPDRLREAGFIAADALHDCVPLDRDVVPTQVTARLRGTLKRFRQSARSDQRLQFLAFVGSEVGGVERAALDDAGTATGLHECDFHLVLHPSLARRAVPRHMRTSSACWSEPPSGSIVELKLESQEVALKLCKLTVGPDRGPARGVCPVDPVIFAGQFHLRRHLPFESQIKLTKIGVW